MLEPDKTISKHNQQYQSNNDKTSNGLILQLWFQLKVHFLNILSKVYLQQLVKVVLENIVLVNSGKICLTVQGGNQLRVS